MKWTDVRIKDGPRTWTGGGARNWLLDAYPGLVSTRVNKLVVLIVKGKPVSNTQAVAEILYALLGQDVTITGVQRPQPQPVQVRRAQPNVVRRPPPKLQMLLDVNRDGAIDVVPANNAQWTWGALGAGAIIAVKTRAYQAAQDVQERSEIRLSWAADPAPDGWQATIAIDQAARARIYRGRREDADLLLGGAQAGPLSLHGDVAIKGALDRREVVSLWIDAPAFPQTDQDADWLVTLTFDFQEGGRQTQQTAVLRLTPWIMASDLQPNAVIYARGTVPGMNPTATIVAKNALSDAIGVFAGGVFHRYDIAANQPAKGFARDVMKSGFIQAPHYSGVAIQSSLDMASPIGALPNEAATRVSAGVFRMPPALAQAANTSQDNGGNLMVSPPSDDYPLGRILYGTSAVAAFVNNSATFYNASGVQDPIILDSTWLNVGHVDEMLSFVRDDQGAYKVLLISPRLAFLLLRAAASTAAVPVNTLVQQAVTANDLLIQAGVHQANTLQAAVGAFSPLQAAVNPRYRLSAVPAYVGNPGVPANSDGWVVMRVTGFEVPEFLGSPRPAFNAVANGPGRVAEVHGHARELLGVAEGMADAFQPIIDQVRATLRQELRFQDADIIDIPCLLNTEAGLAVGLTGDSVNMLVLPGNPESNCLVPKPFGPVYAGTYVFEQYITNVLNALGVQHQFLCDDYLHVLEGEIHCGTNQVPQPLPGNAAKWWNQT